jgi:hypothetical protein
MTLYNRTTWVEKVTKVGPTNLNNLEGGLAAVANNGYLPSLNSEDWYGSWVTYGNAPGSVGFAGTPTAAPATTVGSGGVTLPLTNAAVPITDCAQLSANGGSFTLGSNVVVYSGRSAASGAGNATGCYTLASASGTYASGTALGFTSIGFGPLAIYYKFGDSVGGSNQPIPGSTQGAFLLATYYGPTVDDAMEGLSVFVGAKDTGTGYAQHKQITGFEAIAQLEGANTLLDGDTTPLAASCARTMVIGTAHAKTVSGFRLSHNSVGSTFGFTDKYYGLWQPTSAVVSYTTLNGAATLPTGTITVTSGAAMPPATASNPVTVKLGPNADGVGGQSVTYTGISGNNLTGCTGGTGTVATGSIVTNDAASLNVKDRLTIKAGWELGDTGWSAGMIAATRGGTDGVTSMFAITGPTTAEVTGGLTLVRLNAGSGQTKSILQAFDGSGNNRLSISSTCALILNGVPVVMESSGVVSARIDSSGYVQPGVSTAAGGITTDIGAKIYSGTGTPTLRVVGTIGDIFIRTDGGVGTTIYRCTTAGGAGSAVWTAIL